MATITMAAGLPASQQQQQQQHHHQRNKSTLNTLPDPRSPNSPDLVQSGSNSPGHPELSNEVATLSNKLIHAINHQTALDDTLNETRQQLEAARERIQELERATQEHHSLVTNGILIKRSDVEADTLRLKTSLAEERKAKFQFEKEKKSMEQELESLTASLFEEANEMVASARKEAQREREAIERRNDQLHAQLNDAELLLVSHQEQLTELKSSMQQQNEHEVHTAPASAPSTPGIDQTEHMSKVLEVLSSSPAIPSPPTTYTALLQPILRTDVHPYEDFYALLELSRKSQPASRVNSGTYSGLAGLGLSNLGSHRESSPVSARITPNASSTSLASPNINTSSPATPVISHSHNSSVSSQNGPPTVTPLKETPFYKRILTEDLEPTLRLETAPGLSWLARRGVINAMIDGKLVVEPMPNTARLYQPPCSLCGEQGRGEKRARRHKFRTSESDNAQRYPLCDYCTSRVRASCDFLGFLRLIKDGHWRTDGHEAEQQAWEESVRLRERMFWARVGGGVVPAFSKSRMNSPRLSGEGEQQSPHIPQHQTTRSMSAIESNRPEHSSPLVQESAVDAFQPGFAAPVSPVEHARSSSDQVQGAKSPEPGVGDGSFERPLAKYQRQISSSESNANTPAALSRTATRIRTASRGAEAGGRPSVAQTVAQRAAMFDRTASDSSVATSKATMQASLRASIKHRSPSAGVQDRSAVTSPTQQQQQQQQHDPMPQPPPTPQSSGASPTDEAGPVPGSFNFS